MTLSSVATLIPRTSGRASNAQRLGSVANPAGLFVQVKEDQRQSDLGDRGVVIEDQGVTVRSVAKGRGRVHEHGIGTQVEGLTGHGPC